MRRVSCHQDRIPRIAVKLVTKQYLQCIFSMIVVDEHHNDEKTCMMKRKSHKTLSDGGVPSDSLTHQEGNEIPSG